MTVTHTLRDGHRIYFYDDRAFMQSKNPLSPSYEVVPAFAVAMILADKKARS